MFTKLCRIGNEVTLRYTTDGTPVLNLSLAYTYGRKGNDGKRQTQWVEAAIFGKQAEAVQPFLHKGDQVSVSIDDLHIENYEGRNGPGHKLVGRVVAFDFVGGKRESEPEAKPVNAAPAQQAKGGNFEDFASDIPFN